MAADPPRDPAGETADVGSPVHTAETTPLGGQKSRDAGTPTFANGEVVNGRWSVERFIARGGMGEVYEARDLDLGERVALKTVRPDLARDQGVMERFKREILIARRVSHPNVCRIFDLGRHQPTEGDAVTFLTMELLPGDTLYNFVRRNGPLPARDALPILQQVCWGLAAAHKVGVVHRDFKSGNVMLVPQAQGGVRAVVTDFGQARLGSAEISLTGLDMLMGTPAYMAPEQLLGREVSPATDVYSLGVVLFEMVTGRWPFTGSSPMSVATRRLSEDPPPPRSLAPALDEQWESVILRCLRREPGERWQSPIEVARALGGGGAAGWGRWAVVAAALVALLAGAGLTALHLRDTRTSALAGPGGVVSARRSVAVLTFRNVSGRTQAAWMGPALTEMLSTELAAGGQLRTVPGESVTRASIDLGLGVNEGLAVETLHRVHERLGADLVVLGPYVAPADEDGDVRLDLRAQDTTTGDVVAAVGESGPARELVPLLGRVGARFRAALGLPGLSEKDKGAAAASQPRDLDVARLYASGLTRLRALDAQAALPLLQDAVRTDPSFPLAHAALADAWTMLGYEARAREEAGRAHALGKNLGREDRLAVEGRHREAAREWDKAIEVYRVLTGYFPDNLEHGLRLAAVQVSAGKGKDAIATLDQLRHLPAPLGNDPRLDLTEAQAADALGDFKREAAAAERAVIRGRELGSTLLVARAQRALGWAQLSLGDRPAALGTLAAAQKAYEDAGDEAGRAGAIMVAGIAHARQGNLDAARTRYVEARGIFHRLGDRGGEGRALNNLAILEKERGDVRASLAMQQEALGIVRETGDRMGVARQLNNIGIVQQLQGDLAGSRRSLEEALALVREMGNQGGIARTLNNLSTVTRDQGDAPASRAAAEKAVEGYRGAGDKAGLARAVQNLGVALADAGDAAGARRLQDEALAMRQALGEESTTAESRMQLAELDLAAGNAAAAEETGRSVAARFASDRRPAQEAAAWEMVARARLALGHVPDAREAVSAARALLVRDASVPLQLELAITDARVKVALDPGTGRRALSAAADAAAAQGFVLLALDARLWLAQVDVAMHAPSAAAGRAAAQAEARRRGFAGLAAQR